MEEKRYCGDCDWYIPGGKDPNCTEPSKIGNARNTCPIREACSRFLPRDSWQIPQDEENDLIRRNKCRRVQKTRKRHK